MYGIASIGYIFQLGSIGDGFAAFELQGGDEHMEFKSGLRRWGRAAGDAA